MTKQPRRLSIRVKWSIFISLAIILTLLATTIMMQYTTGKLFKQDAISANEAYTKNVAKHIDLSLRSYESSLDVFSTLAASYASNKNFDSAMQNTIKSIAEANDRLSAVYYMNFLTGELLLSFSGDLDIDTRESTTYKKLKANPELQWLGVNEDKVTGKILASLVAPVMRDGKMIGSVGYDIDLSRISEVRQSLEEESDNSLMILDEKGIIVTSFLQDMDGKNIRPSISGEHPAVEDITDLASYEWVDAIYEGDTHHTITQDGTRYDIYASTIPKLDWKVITYHPQSILMAKMNELRFTALIALIIGLIIGVACASFLAQRLTKIVRNFQKVIQHTADGDLTYEFNLSSRDEIGDLARDYNKMLASVRNLIAHVKQDISTVDAATKGLKVIATDNNTAITEVSKATETIALGAHQQSLQIDQGVATIQQLGSEIDELAQHANVIENEVDNVMKNVQQGTEQVQHLEHSYTNLEFSFHKVTDMIKKLDEQSQSISAVTNTISQISEQTNLLSLNASIEAARAGEHGKGFAVVANEVRSLAEESKASSTHIQQIISNVIADTAELVDVMKETNQTSDEQKQAVVAVSNSILNMAQSLSSILTRVQQETSTIRYIEERKEDVLRMVEDIAAVSQETTATSEEISSSMEEQTAAASEIASYTSQLDNLVIELEQTIQKFKVL